MKQFPRGCSSMCSLMARLTTIPSTCTLHTVLRSKPDFCPELGLGGSCIPLKSLPLLQWVLKGIQAVQLTDFLQNFGAEPRGSALPCTFFILPVKVGRRKAALSPAGHPPKKLVGKSTPKNKASSQAVQNSTRGGFPKEVCCVCADGRKIKSI